MVRKQGENGYIKKGVKLVDVGVKARDNSSSSFTRRAGERETLNVEERRKKGKSM